MEYYKYYITVTDNETGTIKDEAYVRESPKCKEGIDLVFEHFYNKYKEYSVSIVVTDLDTTAKIKKYDSRTDMV